MSSIAGIQIGLINDELYRILAHIIVTNNIASNNKRLWNEEVSFMQNLKKEYTDIKNITHRVQHTVLNEKDTITKEKIIQDLLHALTAKHKRNFN